MNKENEFALLKQWDFQTKQSRGASFWTLDRIFPVCILKPDAQGICPSSQIPHCSQSLLCLPTCTVPRPAALDSRGVSSGSMFTQASTNSKRWACSSLDLLFCCQYKCSLSVLGVFIIAWQGRSFRYWVFFCDEEHGGRLSLFAWELNSEPLYTIYYSDTKGTRFKWGIPEKSVQYVNSV